MRTKLFYRVFDAIGAIGAIALALLLAVVTASGCKKHVAPITVANRGGIDVPASIVHAAYVTNNGSDSLAVFDRDIVGSSAAANGSVTFAPIDVEPDAHEAPHHLAVDVASGSLFVALAFPPDLGAAAKASPHGSHGRGDRHGEIVKLGLTRLDVVASAEVDENPGDVLLSHDRARLFVTHFDMQRAMRVAAAGGSAASMFANVQEWDASTLQKKGERALCVAPHGMAITKDDRTLIVACYGSDEIAIVDVASPNLATSHLALGTDSGVLGAPRYGPYGAVLTDDEAHVVVADLEGEDVRVFDLKNRSFERAVPLGARAMIPAVVAGGAAIVPLQAPDGVARVDVATGAIVKRVLLDKSTCGAPHVAKVAPDGSLYIVCEGDHVAPGAVIAIDPTTLAVLARWVVGVFPDGIDFGK